MIGNLFKEQYTGQIIEVIGLNLDGSIVFSGKFQDNWQADPIALTGEWLLKFGAKKPRNYGIKLDRFRFIWKKEYQYWYVIGNDSACSYMTKIEFVHELQNFFQIMNGQELTLNKD